MKEQRQALEKRMLADQLHDPRASLRRRYQSKVLADRGLGALIRYEIITALATNRTGALGYVLRRMLFPRLFRSIGKGVIFGQGMALRHPDRIRLGKQVAIDDYVMLDAGGAQGPGIRIGNGVIISRNCVVQAKTAHVTIGDRTDIGCNTVISSAGGIDLGAHVLIAGNCYIGGARYRTADRDVPMMDQGTESKGPVMIGDDVWLGAGAMVLDGSTVGRGAIIGAGAVVTGSIPPYAIAVGIPARVVQQRGNQSFPDQGN